MVGCGLVGENDLAAAMQTRLVSWHGVVIGSGPRYGTNRSQTDKRVNTCAGFFQGELHAASPHALDRPSPTIGILGLASGASGIPSINPS